MSTHHFFSSHGPGKRTFPRVSISWSFIVSVVALIALALTIAVGFFWYLSYGFNDTPAGSVTIQHISRPAEISWRKNGLAAITGEDLPSSLAALGYVHATQDPWQMMLWRQTAQGELSAWFGPSLLSLDRLNKQLRFAQLSKATFDKLPPEKQHLLEAYAEGVNAAIQEQNLYTHNEFAFLGEDVATWQPWHALTVERLFAWMTTRFSTMGTVPAGDFDTLLTTLIKSDESLHKFLQVYGFQYSFAGSWQGPDAQETDFFYHRLVYGAAAHSMIQEILIQLPEQQPQLVSTIPGTLVFLSGHGQMVSWALLPSSDLFLNSRTPEAQPTVSHERITNRDGTEVLASFTHYDGLLSLPMDTTLSEDSTYALYWDGFREGTDAFAFLKMLEGKRPALKLLRGDGLWLENQESTLLGNPDYTHNFGRGVLISATPWTAYTAAHLDSLGAAAPERLDPENWITACYNPWAAEYAPQLFSSISNASILASPIYQDAITYFRNWDFTYASSSIGAAIFERWLSLVGRSTASSRLDMAVERDTMQLALTFKQAVDSLNAAYGTDLSQWRLEKTRPVYRYFPAWVADSLYSPDETPLSKTNYAPLVFPGKGDVATLCSGSFTSDYYGTVSAQWETWSTRRDGNTARYWRKQVTPSGFLERYMISNRPNMEYRLMPADEAVQHTYLEPAS